MYRLLTSDVVLAMYEERKEEIAMKLYDNYLLEPEMNHSILGYYTLKDCKGDTTYVVEYMLGQNWTMSVELLPKIRR